MIRHNSVVWGYGLQTNSYNLEIRKALWIIQVKNDQKEVREGKRSIRTYKRGLSIPFPWNHTIRIEVVEKEKKEETEKRNRRDNEEYDFYLIWYNGIRFRLNFGKDRSNNYQIVKRCFKLDENCNANYQLKTSSFVWW